MTKDAGGGWSLDEALAEASLPTERFQVLFDQTLPAEIERLEGELAEQQMADQQVNKPAKAPAIAARIMELHDEAKAKTRTFVFQALPAGGWSDLLAEHPPLAQEDKGIGFNRDEFVPAAIQACCVVPTLKPADVAKVKAHVTEADWIGMFNTVRGLNEVRRGPKSVSPTVRRLATGLRSTSPAPSESPEADSSAAS